MHHHAWQEALILGWVVLLQVVLLVSAEDRKLSHLFHQPQACPEQGESQVSRPWHWTHCLFTVSLYLFASCQQ
jgi:hypothetical protein